MPTNRRYRRKWRGSLQPVHWAYLMDDPKAQELDPFECLILDGQEDKLRNLWNQCREEVLAKWIAERPGTRPSTWWKLEAPRQPEGTHPGCYYDGKLPEPRKRLGGSGLTSWDKWPAYVPWYRCGLPNCWYSIAPDDPPLFESQAAYLKRHGLLEPAEKRRLKASDFKPVSILTEMSDGNE